MNKKQTIAPVDLSKLLKLSTYAKLQGYTRGRIYQMAQAGELNVIEIDSVKFVCTN